MQKERSFTFPLEHVLDSEKGKKFFKTKFNKSLTEGDDSYRSPFTSSYYTEMGEFVPLSTSHHSMVEYEQKFNLLLETYAYLYYGGENVETSMMVLDIETGRNKESMLKEMENLVMISKYLEDGSYWNSVHMIDIEMYSNSNSEQRGSKYTIHSIV